MKCRECTFDLPADWSLCDRWPGPKEHVVAWQAKTGRVIAVNYHPVVPLSECQG